MNTNKKIAFILCVAALLGSTSVNGMSVNRVKALSYFDSLNECPQEIYMKIYEVQTTPSVEVVQADNKIILDGGIIAREMNIECKTYNGIKTTGPIVLRYDMTKDQVIQSLLTAFGSDKAIGYFEVNFTREND